MVLPPMGIARAAPLTVVKETIEIMRQLWTGDSISWQGRRYRLDSARSTMGQQNIPIWLAGRGPKMLALAGAQADGVLLTIKSDLAPALEIVEQGVVPDRPRPERIFLSSLAYTPDMLDKVVDTMVYVIKDAPPRVLRGFGLADEEIANLRQAVETGGPPAAAGFISTDMLKKYQIAGTPAECRRAFQEMVSEQALDVFLLDIVSPNFNTNLDLARNTRALIIQH